MSTKVDQFCEGLRERLSAIEERIQSINASVQDLPVKGEKAVREKLEQVRKNFQAHEERVEKARIDLKGWAEQKAAEAKEAINEWKAKREVRKLNARAERSEAYAEAAMIVALGSIDEAEKAVLEATAARMDADAAQ